MPSARSRWAFAVSAVVALALVLAARSAPDAAQAQEPPPKVTIQLVRDGQTVSFTVPALQRPPAPRPKGVPAGAIEWGQPDGGNLWWVTALAKDNPQTASTWSVSTDSTWYKGIANSVTATSPSGKKMQVFILNFDTTPSIHLFTSCQNVNSLTLNATLTIIDSNYEAIVADCSTGNAVDKGSEDFVVVNPPTLTAPTPSVGSITTSSASVSWSSVSNASSYNLRYKKQSHSTWTTSTGVTSPRSLSSLDANTAYEVQLKAIASSGYTDSAWSSSVNFTTSKYAALPAPSPSVSSITGSGASVSWSSITNAEAYNLRYKKQSGSTWTTRTTTSTSYSLSGLTGNTGYEVQLRSYGSDYLTGSWSSSAYFTTLSQGTLTAPTPDVGNITGSSARVSWSSVNNASSYDLRYKKQSDNTWTTLTGVSSPRTLSSLDVVTPYEVQLKAIASTGYNDSSWSSSTNFTTSKHAALSAPTPSVGSITASGASVTWSSITNATSYDGRYKKQADSTWTESTGVTSAWSLTGLIEGTGYEVQLRSMAANYTDGAWSSSRKFTTAALPPAVIPTLSTASLSIGSDGTNTISATWPAQSNLSATTDWYYLLRVGSASGDAIGSGKFADDSPNLTSGSIAITRKLTPGGTYYVRVMTQPSSKGSQGFKQVTTTTGSACADTDAVDLGKLTGYSTDRIGNLQTTDCTIGGKAADLYKFQLTTARDTDFALTPLTAFDSAGYSSGYSMRVRQTNLAGNSVGHATGLGNLEIDDVAVGAAITYVVEVQRSGIGGGYGYSLNIAYGHIQPPTPTSAPTSTPRPQPNLDFRLVPNPEGFYYRTGEKYEFRPEGTAARYPLTVRSANHTAFALAANAAVDCPDTGNPPSSVVLQNHGDTLYLTACVAGKNSTLTIINNDGALVGNYHLYIGGATASTPVPEDIPLEWGDPGGRPDYLGITALVSAVCAAAQQECDAGLIKDFIIFLVAAIAGLAPVVKGPRNASTGLIAVGALLFVVILMIGALAGGFPLWIVGICLLAAGVLAALGFMAKGQQVRL